MSTMNIAHNAKSVDDVQKGYFGQYGGSFIPEPLVAPMAKLEEDFEHLKSDPDFNHTLQNYLKHYAGRPSPVYFAERLSRFLGGAQIYLKREDLNHTGSHKINNTLGQGLIAKYTNKRRVIAETGAGQHGVATATVAALLGLDCDIFMGEKDTLRQESNVVIMRCLGAKIHPVTSGSSALKDACDAALGYYAANLEDSHFLLGSAVGPHPYPTIVRHFQSVIGREARAQILESAGKLPDLLVGCIGGGSSAIGLFSAFLEDEEVKMICVEAGGSNMQPGNHASRFSGGAVQGVFHGFKSYFLQNDAGALADTHSIAAGLNYPGVGPEHAHLHDTGRVEYLAASDEEVLEAALLLSRKEGILPALEAAHPLAQVIKMAPRLKPDQVILLNLSGRGNKDLDVFREHLNAKHQ